MNRLDRALGEPPRPDGREALARPIGEHQEPGSGAGAQPGATTARDHVGHLPGSIHDTGTLRGVDDEQAVADDLAHPLQIDDLARAVVDEAHDHRHGVRPHLRLHHARRHALVLGHEVARHKNSEGLRCPREGVADGGELAGRCGDSARQPERDVHERLRGTRLEDHLIGAEAEHLAERGSHPGILLRERLERAEARTGEELGVRALLREDRVADGGETGEIEVAGVFVEVGDEGIEGCHEGLQG